MPLEWWEPCLPLLCRHFLPLHQPSLQTRLLTPSATWGFAATSPVGLGSISLLHSETELHLKWLES